MLPVGFAIAGFAAQFIGTIIAIVMLFRTFRKDNEEKLDKKADVTTVTELKEEIKLKADEKTFKMFQEAFNKQVAVNDQNHQEIKNDLKEMVNTMERNVMDKIGLGNKIISEQVSGINASINKNLDNILTAVKSKRK